MTGVFTGEWIWAAALAAAAGLLWPRYGAFAQWRMRGRRRRKERYEDALKHMLAWRQRGRSATPESLAGTLGLSGGRTLELITRMETAGLLESGAEGLRLTPEGERLGLHVVRAHRLWERYLADDAGMPMARLHPAAEKAEHVLSAERLDELDAHLGHPLSDPHGDPIPGRDGSLAPLDAVALTEWPVGEPARIVHIEDEPAAIFEQILAAELRPGGTLRVLENVPDRVVVSNGIDEHRLAHVVAANIQVAAAAEETGRPRGAKRLSDLLTGAEGEVAEIDAECRGFGRRRLMDLGFTPGARVEAALENTFGDPRAFRVRGATVALRKEQAAHVWVRPFVAAEETEQRAEPQKEIVGR